MEPGRSQASEPGSLLLLDGATATNLYAKGLPHDTCVEEWILSHPEAIRELQQEFIEAGSDILYAPTFGANRARLAPYGHADKVRDYNLRLAALSLETAGRCSPAGKRVRVAGNLAPTGLPLLPAGELSFSELIAIYDEQASALAEAGVDLFAIETMLSVAEARAAVLACRKYGKPVFVTMALNEHGELFDGGSFAGALVALQGLGIAGFGLNCSSGLESIAESIREIAHFAAVPLIVKPNAGEPNPVLPGAYDLGPASLRALLEQAVDAGATILGGCCGATPAHIAELRALIDGYTPKPAPADHDEVHDILLASDRELFLLDCDRIEFTEPLLPEVDMADDLLAAEEDSTDVILIQIETPEEAGEFADNAHLARLPVCIHSNSEEALELALLSYHGRCMVDRDCAIPEDSLSDIAARYGAVIY